ncbi:hypothetical protein SEA_PONS_64 [Gordonia phage Pons]|uniref:Uncharacterized protein n=2 Tax=Ponsvirus TaxID=3044795 RepID=A0AAE8Y672_9CAUD|nr:hypothetical protein PP992_gp64 [Gordonia phage Pons]YP_010663127.1 hypothetical protein PP993_gp66 [Gordonia phage Mayweather]QDP45227.1 hypothetical protein SEA_MAYWEATHER_66 [Gordonia phage Mayweather]UDL15224.1 hypothetical protein SEA_PONS_64 [Gordonia phage Pons]
MSTEDKKKVEAKRLILQCFKEHGEQTVSARELYDYVVVEGKVLEATYRDARKALGIKGERPPGQKSWFYPNPYRRIREDSPLVHFFKTRYAGKYEWDDFKDEVKKAVAEVKPYFK